MRVPRDVAGTDLVWVLLRRGYVQVRQTGSHVRLSRRTDDDDQGPITVPMQNPIKVGTLAANLGDVAVQLGVDCDELIREL